VRELLAEALRDPGLVLLFGLLDGRLVDPDGRPADPPEGGRRVAGCVLVHRPVPRYEEDLVDAVLAAAALPLEQARLHAELRVQLAAVQASRTRIVEAADAERRRIERNLHDGAQQRLVALAARLRSEQRLLGDAADPALGGLVDLAVEQLRSAVADLRALAQGLIPAALASEGLGPALHELADRHPADVRLLAVPPHRHRPALEATSWYVATEGLANAMKHASGAPITIAAGCPGTQLSIVVADEGPGGARVDRGTGLRGLVDRVEACGGRLTLTSPPGGGTELRAVLPCG
jgi:signal transduction histidine kinase